MGKLTEVEIRNWVRGGEAVAKSDGEGLTFTLTGKGAASWVLRYRYGGKHKELTIGRYPDITLAAARKLAAEARVKVQQGADVAREKQVAKREAAAAWTVKYLADDYLDKAAGHLAESTLKQRRQQINAYILPTIGRLAVREVKPADVVSLAERAAEKSLHVARLVLVAVRELFAHAVARRVIEVDPSAGVKSKAVIGPRPTSRTRLMLSEGELRAMLPALPALGRSNELALKILLATCTRIGELTQAEWAHIDFERRVWTIPPELAKNKKRFEIPLPDAVVGWFLELHRLAFESRYVLPVRARRGEGDKAMEPTTLNAVCNRLHERLDGSCRRFTPHDLRSTARSHLTAMGVDILVAERCLNHSLGGLVAVYDQHDYMRERRAALNLWVAFILACESGQPWKVVPLVRAGAG